RWRSDPEPRLVRRFGLDSDRDVITRITLRRNDRASDELLNDLSVQTTAASNRRLTGDPNSTAVHAIDGDPATAWTSPFSNAVGSQLTIPADPALPTSTLTLVQTVDQQHSLISRVVVTTGDQSTPIDVPAPDD